MGNDITYQKRYKSILFWCGVISAVYTAITNYALSCNVTLPWWVGAIGVGLSAFLGVCVGNNPNMANKY